MELAIDILAGMFGFFCLVLVIVIWLLKPAKKADRENDALLAHVRDEQLRRRLAALDTAWLEEIKWAWRLERPKPYDQGRGTR